MSDSSYRCRPVYLWRGCLDALKSRASGRAQAPTTPPANQLLKVLAPLLAVLLLARLLVTLSPTIVAAVRDYGSVRMALVAGALLTLSLLLLPIFLLLRGVRAVQRLCRRGWELSQEAPAPV